MAKYKGSKLFRGYVTSDYYLEYFEELGAPTKVEPDDAGDTENQLLFGIKEIERLQNNLIQREKEIAVLRKKNCGKEKTII